MNLSPEVMARHGVIPLLKPPGMTSHDAVAHVRRVLKNKRVGHTGTLDPAAAGVLPICIGQATRLVETLQNNVKEYLAEVTFGYETDTLDAVGQIVRQCQGRVECAQVEAVCRSFRGNIEQEPPLHSAIKVGGRKLYDIARAGGQIEVPRRVVTISRLEVTRFFEGPRPRAFLRIECSSGTYIRSLVRDIGRALENAATMTFLLRLQSGGFDLNKTLTPAEFEFSRSVIPLPEVLQNLYGPFRFDDEATMDLWQGKSVQSATHSQTNTRVIWSNSAQTLLALASARTPNQWKADKVFDLRTT